MEVTTLVISGWNDTDQELKDIARFIAGLSPDIPWHVSRFFPRNRYDDRGPTGQDSLNRALDAGRKAGLHYVFAGNIPGDCQKRKGQKRVLDYRAQGVAMNNMTDLVGQYRGQFVIVFGHAHHFVREDDRAVGKGECIGEYIVQLTEKVLAKQIDFHGNFR